MARQPAGPSSARGVTTISTPTVPRIGPSDCSSAITATFSVTIPTWNADRVTPLTRAPATARWCQRPRSAAQECRPTSAARPKRGGGQQSHADEEQRRDQPEADARRDEGRAPEQDED